MTPPVLESPDAVPFQIIQKPRKGPKTLIEHALKTVLSSDGHNLRSIRNIGLTERVRSLLLETERGHRCGGGIRERVSSENTDVSICSEMVYLVYCSILLWKDFRGAAKIPMKFV